MERSRSNVGEVALRVLAGLLATAALGYLAFLLLFVGMIEATGCFLECRDPNLWAGLPLLAGSALSAAGAVSTLVWALTGASRRRLGGVFLAALGLGAGVLAIGALT